MANYHLHLLIFFVLQLTLLAKGQESENLFQIENDSRKVENRLINFINYRNELTEPARILWKKISKKNICNRSQRLRRELCRRIMRYEFNGFEVDEQSLGQVFSMKRPFELRFHTLDRSLCKLTMFWCPMVTHFNLETGENENFPLFYNISRAKQNNALFVYVQQENLADDPIYPRHYLHNVHLKQMRKLMVKREREPAPSVAAVKINANCQKESLIRNTFEYIRAMKVEDTYLKFAIFFASVSICSVRRTHKIHACRLALKHQVPNVELDILGYKFPRCRKHSFHVASEDGRIADQHRGAIYALPCPPLKYKSILPARHIVSPILHFISSTLMPDSVLLYSRLNKYKYELQAKCYFDRLQLTQLFAKDLRRTKLLFYPHSAEGIRPRIYITQEDYYTNNVSNIDSARGSVKMPLTIEKDRERDEAKAILWSHAIPEEIGPGNGEFEPDEILPDLPVSLRPIRVIYDRWFTEYAVLSFHKVRQEKLVYEKFRRTYASIDICYLTHRQKNELCVEFLQDHGFAADQSPSDEAIDYPCVRREITLTRHEAEYLGAQDFSMWQCPPCQDGHGRELTFYVGKSDLKDAAIVYRLTHFEGVDFVFPDLFVSHVNRHTLADAVLLARSHWRDRRAPEIAGTSRGSAGIGGLVSYESFRSRDSDGSDDAPLISISLTGR